MRGAPIGDLPRPPRPAAPSPDRSSSPKRRSTISPRDASTSSCIARKRPTEICGAGCSLPRGRNEKSLDRDSCSLAFVAGADVVVVGSAARSATAPPVFTAAQATAGPGDAIRPTARAVTWPISRARTKRRSWPAPNFRTTWRRADDARSDRVHAGDDAAGPAEPGDRRTTSTSRRSSCDRTARPPARRR